MLSDQIVNILHYWLHEKTHDGRHCCNGRLELPFRCGEIGPYFTTAIVSPISDSHDFLRNRLQKIIPDLTRHQAHSPWQTCDETTTSQIYPFIHPKPSKSLIDSQNAKLTMTRYNHNINPPSASSFAVQFCFGCVCVALMHTMGLCSASISAHACKQPLDPTHTTHRGRICILTISTMPQFIMVPNIRS